VSFFEASVLFLLFMIFVCLWRISESLVVFVNDHQLVAKDKLARRGTQGD
jgi:hypothetical protein